MKRIILFVGAAAAVVVIGMIAIGFLLSRRQTPLLPVAPEHGTSFLLESDDTNTTALQTALRGRFSDLDVRLFLETVSPTRIRIVIPPVADGQNQSALENIVGGQLEFRLVHENSPRLLEEGSLDPGFEVLKQNDAASDGSAHVVAYLVKKKPELTGKYVRNALVMHDQIGQPEIEFTLTPEGAGIFTKVTGDNIGRQLAIVVDGKLVSAPRIQGVIDANGVITGHFTEGEAVVLAAALNHPLPVPVKLIEMKKF